MTTHLHFGALCASVLRGEEFDEAIATFYDNVTSPRSQHHRPLLEAAIVCDSMPFYNHLCDLGYLNAHMLCAELVRLAFRRPSTVGIQWLKTYLPPYFASIALVPLSIISAIVDTGSIAFIRLAIDSCNPYVHLDIAMSLSLTYGKLCSLSIPMVPYEMLLDVHDDSHWESDTLAWNAKLQRVDNVSHFLEKLMFYQPFEDAKLLACVRVYNRIANNVLANMPLLTIDTCAYWFSKLGHDEPEIAAFTEHVIAPYLTARLPVWHMTSYIASSGCIREPQLCVLMDRYPRCFEQLCKALFGFWSVGLHQDLLTRALLSSSIARTIGREMASAYFPILVEELKYDPECTRVRWLKTCTLSSSYSTKRQKCT